MMPNPLILDRQDFKVLSSDTRVSMLKLLAERQHTSSELAQKLKLSAPTIAEHIDMLHKAKLVEMKDDGHKWKYYALSKKGKKLVDSSGQENVLVMLTPLLIGLLGIALIGFGLVSNPFMADSPDAAGTTSLMTTPDPNQKMSDAAYAPAVAASETTLQDSTMEEPPSWTPITMIGIALIAVSLVGIYRNRRTYFGS